MAAEDVIRVLLIDDSEKDFLVLKKLFNDISGNKYHVDWLTSYEEGMAEIEKARHAIYLVDYQLGISRKGESDIVRNAILNGCKAPFIVLTRQHSPEIDRAAMHSGALDFLVKSELTSHELESSVRYSINIAKNIEQVKNLNADLERRVDERTKGLIKALEDLEISKEETEKALKKEKELNELKSRFVTMASHEFRTPLSTILSSINLISKYSSDESAEKRVKHIDRVRASVHSLTDILEDFLSLGKLEEGAISAHPEHVDFNDLCQQVVVEMQSFAGKREIIQYIHSGLTDDVLLDPNLVRNILINLLSNAIKFSPDGKEILLRAKQNKNELLIEIKDQGIGIPESDQKHLFERFFRASNVTNIQGTGLGLNIVKKYVDMLKGEISFSSKFEEGSTFILKLPV